MLAALESAMRVTVLSVLSSSRAARMLAAPASSVRDAEPRASSSLLGTALLLTAFASTVRHAEPAVLSSSRAACVLAAFASSVRHTEPRAASSLLGAALLLALFLAHASATWVPNPNAVLKCKLWIVVVDVYCLPHTLPLPYLNA